MFRVVLDTNIFVSSIFWEKGNSHKIIGLVLDGRTRVFTSLSILQELEKVLRRDFEEPEGVIQRQLALIVSYAVVVRSSVKVQVVKEDPDDNKILECAMASKADYIVSGDKHLLALGSFRGIKIISARQFMDLF